MDEILLNRLSKFIEEVKSLSNQAHNVCKTLDDNNLESAKVITAKLKSILSRFTTELYNYFKICNNPDADEISNFTTFQLQGEEILIELETKLKMKTEQPMSKDVQPFTHSKLPDLNMPTFSGDILDWHQFWDQFTSNINRRKMSDVDKLLYLKGSLKGEAARLIDGFDTSNRSYEVAITTLKSRYGKDGEIIYAHHKALSKVKRAERVEDCRSTLDEIQRHLRILQSMGENVSSNQMRYLVMEKFPTEIIYEIKMRLGATGTEESVEEILKQLALVISTKEEARRITQENANETPQPKYTVETLHIMENSQRDKSENSKFGFSSNIKQNYKRRWNNVKPGTSKWSPKQNNRPMKRKFEPKEGNRKFNADKRKKWSCIFCGENHANADCDKIKTIDERKAKLKNRCFICFKIGHIGRYCRSKKLCEYCGKFGVHHKALCHNKLQKCNKTEEKERTSAMHINLKSSTVLQTVVVNVKGHNDITRMCRILLDCGSQRSYITRDMAKELNLQVQEQNDLSIFTFGSKTPKEVQSSLVKLDIWTRNDTYRTIFANVVPNISQGVLCAKEEIRDWPLKEKYTLADDVSLSDRVDILLGNDYYYTIISNKKIFIKEDLYLVESELGWILSGRTSIKPTESVSVLTYFQSSCEFGLNQPDPPLDNGDLKRLWDLESIGITDSPKLNRDEEAVKHFNETTEYKDNRYHVSWPWNDSTSDLPSNFGLAFGRLVNLLKRLDSETLQLYNKTLTEQLEKGIIEEVSMGKQLNHPVHYIPHHGVSAPGKSLRIVYDASAKTKNNKSLNEHLYCGPMLLEDLTGLLIKFRCYTVGLTADVEKAFLQIGLKEHDRDVTRFLWVKDINEPATENNLVHLRFTRVPFGIISSPFILNATVKYHLKKAEDESVRSLANAIYVDNLVTGTNSTEDALELYRKSKETFQLISMNLRQWSSNSKDFMQNIPDGCPGKIVKLLGLDWQLENDTLHLRVKALNEACTKRGILKTIASIYDPCGYAVPTLLAAKILLQDLWKTKTKWDTPLPSDIADQWSEIKENLKQIKEVNVERCYFKNSESKDCEIHCFTDSSTKAYSAVVYIVGKNEKQFVIGKSRLVPLKDQEHLKIPRLELLGVLIGSRLIQYVLSFLTLNVTKQVLWTDSQIVIDWLNSNKLLTPFVSRRINEIKRNKDLIVRYVPSELNPADVATRPTTSEEDREKWLLGPDFLLQEPSRWPTSSVKQNSFFVGEDLTKNNETQEELQQTTEMEVCTNTSEIQEQLLDVSTEQSIRPEVEPEDNTLKEIMKIQAEYFKDEVNGKVTSLSRNLGLFKDVDGILRCKGRLKYADWSFDKRYPVIIPKDCDFTNKVIKDTHERNYHVGINHTLSIIRQNYWIPRGKQQVRKILKKCPRCVKHGGRPFKLPQTPALPHERVNYSKPFTFTGVDYLGPVIVKTEKGTSKRWICLFTCLAIRAVHLEVVEDLSAEEGLLALRRMIATRGVPTLITSDNALHFKLIADIVSNKYCVENQIKWRFIPELAPWAGGFYERLVSLVKQCMKRTLQKHLLKDSQLSTMIKEIEAVINTRPLICVDSELEHILKPSDFLQTGRCVTLETGEDDVPLQGTSTKTNLIEGWRKGRIILEEFKEIFHNRYLPSLRERYNHSHKQPRVLSKLTPKEGQIVQIKGDKNREGWKVGKIISLIQGSDGLVRVARVKVGNSTFTRSIAHLYPLEMEEAGLQDPEPQDSRVKYGLIKFPTETSEVSKVVPNVVISEPDNEQTETVINKEQGNVDDVDMIDDTLDVTSKEADKESESTDKDVNYLRDDSNKMDKDMTKDNEMVYEEAEEIKHKRVAAVRALEKIREWTQNLMTLL